MSQIKAQNQFSFQIKLNRLYSTAFETGVNKKASHRWALRYRFEGKASFTALGGTYGKFQKTTGWILSPNETFGPFPNKDFPEYVEIELHGWENENSGTRLNRTCKMRYYFDQQDRTWKRQTMSTSTCYSDDAGVEYRADISIRYEVPQPAGLITIRENADFTPAGWTTNYLCEGNTIYTKLASKENNSDVIATNKFEYYWEYHFDGDVSSNTTCTISFDGDELSCLGVEPLLCADAGTYDPSCQSCDCTTTHTDIWRPLSQGTGKFNFSFPAFRRGDMNNMSLRVSFRRISNNAKSPLRTNSNPVNVFVMKASPTLANLPAAVNNSSNITTTNQLITGAVANNIQILNAACYDEDLGKIIINSVTTGTGHYYFNLRHVASGGTWNVNGLKAEDRVASGGSSGLPIPGGGPKPLPKPSGGSIYPVIFPDSVRTGEDGNAGIIPEGLPSGQYILKIENMEPNPLISGNYLRLCFNEVLLYIREPEALPSPSSVVLSNYNDVTVRCKGNKDATITVTGTGGVGKYHFFLYDKGGNGTTPIDSYEVANTYKSSHKFGDADASTGALLSNIRNGVDYYVIIEDELGCQSASVDISIIEPIQLSGLKFEKGDYTSNGITKNISCYGESDGFITDWEVNGGVGLKSYHIEDASNVILVDSQGDPRFNLLSANVSYTLHVTDVNGCTIESSGFTLSQPSIMEFGITSAQHPICIDGSDGSITISGSGGLAYNDSGAYRFYIDGYKLDPRNLEKDKTGNSVTLEGLTKGDHTVIMEGFNGCIISTEINVPENPNPLGIKYERETPPSCDGVNDGTLTVSAFNTGGDELTFTITPNTIGGYPYTFTGPATEVTFEGLANNDHIGDLPYKVTVTHRNDMETCSATSIDMVLDERSDPLTLVYENSSEPSCYGFDDGWITFRATGGDTEASKPYRFSKDGGTTYIADDGDGLFTISNLKASSSVPYKVFVVDANYNDTYEINGYCRTDAEWMLNQPDFIEFDGVEVNVACHGENTGGVDIPRVDGGPDPLIDNYTFQWIEFGNSQVISTNRNLTNVLAGSYVLTVFKDGCSSAPIQFNVQEPSLLEISELTPSPTSCLGANDGFVTMKAIGGTAPYRYFVDGVPSDAGLFKNLAPGMHNITVIDSAPIPMCSADSTFEIGVGVVGITVESVTHETCSYRNNGTVKLSATGVNPPFVYSIDGGDNYKNVSTFVGLTAGTYYAIVLDDKGCTSEQLEIEITEPDELIIDASVVKDAACLLKIGAGASVVTGGTPFADVTMPYQVTWRDINNQLVNQDSLYAGNYTVEVTDANGCQDIDNITINDLPPHTLIYQVHAPAYCGLPLGIAEVEVAGGVGIFTYLWDDENATESAQADQLVAGQYKVLVTDVYRGCVQEITVVITDGPALQASHLSNSATCNQADGDLTLSVIGGVAPYTYDWGIASTSTTQFSDGLIADVYEVIIRDAVGCELPYLAGVNNENGPLLDKVTITSSYCGLATGTAQVTVLGGTFPYTYEWTSTDPIQTTALATGLLAGKHLVKITDDTGCVTIVPVTIEDDILLEPSMDITSVLNSACELAIGSAEVAMTGGLPPYTYDWQGPVTASSALVNDLLAGMYEVTGTDAKGCIQVLTIEIVDSPDPVLIFGSTTLSACGLALGSATVEASGGQAPYTYDWSDDEGQTTATASNLLAGTYEVYGIDANGCITSTLTIEIGEESAMELILTDIIATSCVSSADGSLEIGVINGSAPYTYLWNNGQDAERATGLIGGLYNITVTDANDCTVSMSGTVPVPTSVEILDIGVKTPDCHGTCDAWAEALVTGGAGGYTYLWSGGQTLAKAADLCSGVYTLEVTDANGCTASQTVTIEDPEKIETTGIAAKEILCVGQSTVIDPGVWGDYSWTSTTGFSSSERMVTLSEDGMYYLEVHSDLNCLVQDTIEIETRTDILDGDFLMASEANVGDTVVLVDISWPLPDGLEWTIPKEATELVGNDWYRELKFEETGTFEITLNATLGECADEVAKQITIYEAEPTSGRVDRESGLINEFTLFPNPNDGEFSVKVDLNESSDIRLMVINLTNGEIEAEYEGINNELYEVEFNIPQLTAGVYLLHLSVQDREQTLRFIVH